VSSVEERRPCQSCGAVVAEPGRAMPLCTSCRARLVARPFPSWIMAAAALIGVLMLVELTKFPAAFSAAVAYERGQRAEARRDFPAALTEYSKAAQSFPNAIQVVARRGIAAYRAGNLAVTVESFRAIGGRNVGDEAIASEVNQIIAAINAGRPEGLAK